jgi:hypothetical protein
MVSNCPAGRDCGVVLDLRFLFDCQKGLSCLVERGRCRRGDVEAAAALVFFARTAGAGCVSGEFGGYRGWRGGRFTKRTRHGPVGHPRRGPLRFAIATRAGASAYPTGGFTKRIPDKGLLVFRRGWRIVGMEAHSEPVGLPEIHHAEVGGTLPSMNS